MAVCLLQISPIFHEDERHTDSARQLDCCLLVASSTSHRAPSKKGLDNCGFSGGDSTPIDILCGVFFLVCMFSFIVLPYSKLSSNFNQLTQLLASHIAIHNTFNCFLSFIYEFPLLLKKASASRR
mmetsp:Transcript_22147/g.37901  ORF Transcript_22147/g.37901 Transcript_22147/m.37901 type:complete len:125 (+) Transcript_22147:286-660(+)